MTPTDLTAPPEPRLPGDSDGAGQSVRPSGSTPPDDLHVPLWGEEEADDSPRAPRTAIDRLKDVLGAERHRLPLWLPVAIGLGIAAYFSFPIEPPAWVGLASTAIFLVSLWATQRQAVLAAIISFALAFSVGLAAAQVRTALVAAPMLDNRVGPTLVEGTVIAIETRVSGSRLLLGEPWVEDLSGNETPRRIRLSVRGTAAESLQPGARVQVLASLLPPRGPVIPGARDFRRRAFFSGLGAVGFTLGDLEIVASAEPTDPGLGLETLRRTVVDRIDAVLDGDEAAIATALMTGERGLIREPVYDAIQASGLAHLLAISGLHIGLVAGLVFFTVRGGLALIAPLALNWPIKKVAAIAAWFSALAYMLLVGSPVPTERAFLMTSLVLLAVLVDRTAITMRPVAWAAVAILIMSPEALLGASFQMSFAAVVSLVAAYEGQRGRWAEWQWRGGLGTRLGVYLLGVALTTLVAGIATAPFAMAHFQRLATYGAIANLVAVPLTAFWIMPSGLISALLMPFGLESIGLIPMGWGIDYLLSVAEAAGAWPGAALVVPAMPGWGLAAAALGGLWLCLWRQPWRYAGILGVVLAFASPGLADRPDLMINENGRLLAVRTADGGLLVSTNRRERFTRDTWLDHVGERQAQGAWPDSGESADGAMRCDALGCLYRTDSWTVALVRQGRALTEDCRIADIVMTGDVVPRGCPATVIIDRFDLWRDGAHAVYLNRADIRVRAVGQETGDRPWR